MTSHCIGTIVKYLLAMQNMMTVIVYLQTLPITSNATFNYVLFSCFLLVIFSMNHESAILDLQKHKLSLSSI